MMELISFKPLADAEVEETMRFEKSLQELRELRSELHKAAEYCETTFSKSEEKSDVLDNTKEYICRTMVTVVDHLGNVSANLDGLISHTNAFSEAELRIQCLQQRLLSCEQYARKLALAKLQWNENSLRFHSRYLSTSPLERSSSKKVIRDSESQVPSKLEDKQAPETYEDLPLFLYTHKPPVQNLKPTAATLNGHINLAMVAPVKDGLSFLTKVPNPTFHFQGTQKVGRHRRSLYGSDILWLLRRSKRAQ
ncbi:hypothetical protein JHK82_013767 [Glycine max]|uniref:Protein ABIL5 n=2 Tax=Glycine subgen. Soja TaxID=1462606 RepID=I1K5V6_SOYBN|nr:probable protein ABIL5 [Glycine max]XP_028233845.1 probable protein ABIL5 [Glycine soja]KAG5030167.1 hypothetical protein JHK87_013681 [Glycine soja]KAG5058784.1 hypothetical protein JHK86_013780 [Glycine max]KAG5155798.1 hypothetical protein JHK82_013767 [Glycine max]KAH1135894.1 hypothetical protein GYH30_013548 [Glycine max]KAH1251733.1 putative protein ABIL5 [Glycine max]|eukprot:XP_003525272.1 probable protein ABIL5 [Glycine max]